MLRRLTVSLFSAAALALLVAGPAAAEDLDCPDFPTQGAAQEYFDSRGGSPTNNVDNLDADHDGVACERNPGGGGGDADGNGQAGAGEEGSSSGEGGSGAEDSELPFTGSGSSSLLGGLAGLLLAVGGALLWRLRYRPSH